MKFIAWFRRRSLKEWAMIVVILLLAIMIATRWSEITGRIGSAFENRFTPAPKNP
jgi:hypothetical protein